MYIYICIYIYIHAYKYIHSHKKETSNLQYKPVQTRPVIVAILTRPDIARNLLGFYWFFEA